MKILLCTDGSEGAGAAIDLVGRLPLPEESTIVVLSVVEGHEPFARPEDISHAEEREALEALRAELQQEADELVADAAELLKTGLAVRTELGHGDPTEAIVAAASELRADVVVLGAQGRRAKRPLGRVCRGVVKRAPCPVLVARPRAAPSENPERLQLLLAFDDSEPARRAADLLTSLPLDGRAAVTVLTVLTVATTLYSRDILERMSETWQAYKAEAQARLSALADDLRRVTPDVAERLLDGGPDAADEILDAAQLLASDVVVLGRSGKGAIKELLLGSVAAEILERAPCSVWVVPG